MTQKAQAAPASTQNPSTPVTDLSLSQLADEFAEVRQRMMAWRPQVNPDAQRYNDLAAELLRRQENEPAEKQIQVQGDRFIVPISPRHNQSTIVDPLALFKKIRRLGIEKTVELYSITLANVRRTFTTSELKRFIRDERTGPRTIGEPVWKDQA